MDDPRSTGSWIHRLSSARAARELADITLHRSLRGLRPADRRILADAQIEATRPIVSGVILSGAVMLALAGLFEGTGLAPGIGYPWWLVELAGLAVAGCALGAWYLQAWPVRLLLALLGIALTGVFLSIAARGLAPSAVMLDIDHFKHVNDTWGHAAGGEEFVVLFASESPEAVEGFAQRVRHDFAQATRDCRVTVSAGVAHRLEGESLADLLRRADRALYRAQDEGRDRMVVAGA